MAYELAFLFDRFANRFTKRYLWLADVRFNVKFASHAFDDNIQVQFTHAGYDRLARFFVGLYPKRWVFPGQFAQCSTHLLLIRLGFRLNRDRYYRFGKINALQHNFVTDVAQGIPSADIFKPHRSCYIACPDFFQIFARIRMHLQNSADTILLATGRIEYRISGFQDS